MRRSSRCRLGVLAALLPTLPACYEYRPLDTQTPPVGEQVAMVITDQGRVSLAERFGAGLAEIQGRVVSSQGSEYVVNVYRVSQISGESAAWSGETTRINRSFVGTVKGRQVSALRTTLASVIGGVALYFLVSRELSGHVAGADDDTPPPPPPLSIRIPLGLRF